MNTQEIIQKAKDLFPCGYHFTGMLTDEEWAEIKEVCTVQTFGCSHERKPHYRIVYKGEPWKE